MRGGRGRGGSRRRGGASGSGCGGGGGRAAAGLALLVALRARGGASAEADRDPTAAAAAWCEIEAQCCGDPSSASSLANTVGLCCNQYPPAEAWACTIEALRSTYAFGEWKQLNWTAVEESGADWIQKAAAADDPGDRSSLMARALQAAIARIPDGHVWMTINGANGTTRGRPAPYFPDYGYAPGGFGFAMLPDKDGASVVVAVDEQSEAWARGVRVGQRVTTIDGVPAAESLASSAGWLESSTVGLATEQKRVTANHGYAARARPGDVRLWGFEGDGAPAEPVELTAYDDAGAMQLRAYQELLPAEQLPPGQVWLGKQDGDKPEIAWGTLPSGVGYLRVVALENPDVMGWTTTFLEALDALRDTDGLVMDIRGNGGGIIQWAAWATGLFLAPGEENHFEFVTFEEEYQRKRTEKVASIAAGVSSAEDSDLFEGFYNNFTQSLPAGGPDGFLVLTKMEVPYSDESNDPRLMGIFDIGQATTNDVYTKPMVMLVDRYTHSAGEGLALGCTLIPRCEVVGLEGTGGSLGFVGGAVKLTDNATLFYPIGQALDSSKTILVDSKPNKDGVLEGGVLPTSPIARSAENLAAHAQTHLQWAAGGQPSQDFELDQAEGVLLDLIARQ